MWPDQTLDGFDVSPVAKDFISRLLIKDRKRRLGARGPNEVLGHPFLSEINVEELEAKRINAPFIPKVPDLKKLLKNVDEGVTESVMLVDVRETEVPQANK